jgi:hypothetical protein
MLVVNRLWGKQHPAPIEKQLDRNHRLAFPATMHQGKASEAMPHDDRLCRQLTHSMHRLALHRPHILRLMLVLVNIGHRCPLSNRPCMWQLLLLLRHQDQQHLQPVFVMLRLRQPQDFNHSCRPHLHCLLRASTWSCKRPPTIITSPNVRQLYKNSIRHWRKYGKVHIARRVGAVVLTDGTSIRYTNATAITPIDMMRFTLNGERMVSSCH